MRRDDIAISIEKLGKEYRLGTIGGSTLSAELQSKWARWRGKEDPNVKLGESSDSYGESFWALKDINLEIHKGECIAIVGKNGSGKSTFAKLISFIFKAYIFKAYRFHFISPQIIKAIGQKSKHK